MSGEMDAQRGTPSAALVAAWLAMDNLRAESVPMWAAEWLIAGYDGQALAELAGLSGQDTREVRDLLPAALADTGIEPMSSTQAALKIAYDHIATMYLTGRVRWRWVVTETQALVIANHHAPEAFDQPLGDLWAIDDELGHPWSRTDPELAEVVRKACLAQVESGPTEDAAVR